ncbi:hypothetical protein [Synechocystis salina]|uniref:hypothetical protein n=1 Tax=Synechocystis salina TaxID=945780 RepID=UPI001D13CFC3|nr:hypothetical protein [Synechocystis salina]
MFQNVVEKVVQEIKNLNNEYILKASQTELEDFYIDKVSIEPISLLIDELYIEEQTSVQIDVSNDSRRFIIPGRTALVPGTRLDVAVPYEGDPELWKIKPSCYTLSSYPEILVRKNEIVLSISFTDDLVNSLDLKSKINRDIELLANTIQNLRSDVENHNRGAPDRVKEALQLKRHQAETAVGAVAALEIPIKRRNKPLTFTVPTSRRKSPKSRPKVNTEVYKLEPTLDEAEYQHILEVMRGMSLVIERSPSSFSTLDEEAIRTHFLLQLNGHYEGNASGETFNASGKTDILIRVENRNIFIAECKFWCGAKAFNNAVNQLLGYLSWRDTKCALLIFNRTKDSSGVKQKMHDAMEGRSEYRKTVLYDPHKDSRYIFVKESDPGREIIITTQLYDIPTLS